MSPIALLRCPQRRAAFMRGFWDGAFHAVLIVVCALASIAVLAMVLTLIIWAGG